MTQACRPSSCTATFKPAPTRCCDCMIVSYAQQAVRDDSGARSCLTDSVDWYDFTRQQDFRARHRYGVEDASVCTLDPSFQDQESPCGLDLLPQRPSG